MNRILSMTMACLLCALCAAAQDGARSYNKQLNNVVGLSWEIAVPTNSNFLTATSLAGGKVEYRKFLPGKPVSFGVSLGWNSYEQYIPTQTITYDNGTKAITTDMDRNIYTVPVAALGHYYFNYGKTVMPFVGLGIGAQYSEQTIYYNIFESDDYNWGSWCARSWER